MHDNPMVSNDEDHGYNDGEFFENSSCHCDWVDNDKSSSNESHSTEERTAYWESQKSLLQEILEHHSSTGAKLRHEIKRIIETARETKFCKCLKPKSGGGNCYKCLRQRVVNLLSMKGHNATLCVSQWNRTSKYLGGTHEFIEVIIASTQSRKKQVPFLIELEFRDQFKMAKACEEYDDLVNQLPEIYIGKAEHLNSIVGVVCDAAKKSTQEKRMHMGPWRKRSFMQKKWSGSSRLLNESLSSPSSDEPSLASPITQVDMPRVSSYLRFSSAAVLKVA